MPRVTVIVPCYNDGATVGETVASCRDEECEVVVVDDGSTDPATVEVLDALAGGNVRLVRQANAGLGPARMRAVQEARTPYVMPLDADDVLLPGTVAAFADFLDAHPGIDVVWGDYEVFGDYAKLQHTTERIDPWFVTYSNEVAVAAMIRRGVVIGLGGWQGPRGYEDWNLWLACAERGVEGQRLPIVAFRYRRHGRRMSHDSLAVNAANEEALRLRHPALFAARRHNWRRSRAPWATRLLFPLIDAVPRLPEHVRLMLLALVSDVGHRRYDTLRWTLERRARGLLGWR